MTYRVSITISAASGERFAPDAFDRQIGGEIAIRVAAGEPITGTLVAACVSGDGSAAELSINVPMPPPPLLPGYRGMSFGFNAPEA